MYYQFGIFCTIYAGKEMPNWISYRSKGSSMSFTIPSSPNKLRGLNLCYVEEKSYSDDVFVLPVIEINNLTKNYTWLYLHYHSIVSVDEECIVFLSHWMFGKNEMEDGDQFTISMEREQTHKTGSITECGVGFVYDDGRMREDALDYYKSWNHIIGGDLSAFQLKEKNQSTTVTYILFHQYVFQKFQGDRIRFRAFSQQKSDLVVHRRVGRDCGPETIKFRGIVMKMMESLKSKIAIVDFIYNMLKFLKVKTRSHLCFSLKLHTLSRFLRILYILLVLTSCN